MEPNPALAAERLRQIRARLGITTRDVEQRSREIAGSEQNPAYLISHARLVQIENGQSTPSIHKLFSLSAIYGVKLTDLVALYIGFDRAMKYHLSAGMPNTHRVDFDSADGRVEFPVRVHPGADPSRTNLLSQVVEAWGEVPVELLQRMNLRKKVWGYIGLDDYTLYPLLRPGSLVQIDPASRNVSRTPYPSELDRPIYFIELREGYICSWCELRKSKLVSVPHPLSPVGIREFEFPKEAEVVGRVTAVAARLVGAPAPS